MESSIIEVVLAPYSFRSSKKGEKKKLLGWFYPVFSQWNESVWQEICHGCWPCADAPSLPAVCVDGCDPRGLDGDPGPTCSEENGHTGAGWRSGQESNNNDGRDLVSARRLPRRPSPYVNRSALWQRWLTGGERGRKGALRTKCQNPPVWLTHLESRNSNRRK